jgi:hypothetical protein
MKSKSSILFRSMLLLFSLLLCGCGGDSSGNNTTESINTPGNIIGGVASKGIISEGVVTIYAVNEDGSLGEELGSAQTDANGKYSIDIGDHSDPVVIIVTGGSYTDEATGVTVDNTKLRAFIPAVNGNEKAAVTPVTEIAVQIAGETYTLERINNANAAVAVLLGGADIVETQPQDIDGDLSGATDAEKAYTMLLAAISQMIEDGCAVDVADAVAQISADLADDGQLGSLIADKIIQDDEHFGGFQEDNTGFTGDLLREALANFIASDENNTGLVQEDIALDEALDEAVVKFILTMEESEYDGDDMLDERITYTYDANGNTSIFEQDGMWDDDIVINGDVNYRINYTYNDAGRVTQEDQDNNGDGTINYRKVFTYDANGNMTLEQIDSNADETFNYIVAYTYDANGNKTLQEYDTDGDSTVDLSYSYTYDADNNMTMQERDTNADSVVDLRYTYTYDADGHRTGFESDGANNEPPDGIANTRSTYTYGENGKMATQQSDTNGDGTFNMLGSFTYNEDGNKTMFEYDYGVLGVVDERTTCTFDVYGNRTSCEYDDQVDGVIDQSTKYTWTQVQ